MERLHEPLVYLDVIGHGFSRVELIGAWIVLRGNVERLTV
jgi:hypothetical protein